MSNYDLATYHMRYWKARGRLIGDYKNRNVHNGFMVVGNQSGMSIPAEYRVPNKPGLNGSIIDQDPADKDHIGDDYLTSGDCSAQPGINNIDFRDGLVKSGFLNWADATIQLSHYIITLCYEWQLLKRTNNGASGTEEELYYALKAIKRLDRDGESLIPQYHMPFPYSNGYFVRDDVPYDFALKHMGINYDFVRSDRSCGPGSLRNEESYDQAIAIQLALATVKKFIPESVIVQGERIRDINHSIAIDNTNYLSRAAGWILRNPSDSKPVDRGYEGGLFFAYPMSTAGRVITDDNGRWRDFYSNVLGRAIWREIKVILHSGGGTVNASLISLVGGVLVPITKSLIFGSGATDSHENDNVNMFLQAAIASRTAGIYNPNPFNWINDPDGAQLINDMGYLYKKEFYHILGSDLIGYDYGDGGHNEYWMKEFGKFPCACNCLFNDENNWRQTDDSGCVNLPYTTSAPNPIAGNRDIDPDYMHPYPWTTPNRWEHWKRDPISHVFREFDGVDYLETFSAYMYHFHSNQGLYGRLRIGHGEVIPFNAQRSRTPVGSASNPFYLKSVFDISSRTLLDGSRGAVANFYAGSVIDLLPNTITGRVQDGFSAQFGSTFDASIRGYDCLPMMASSSEPLYRTASTEGDSNDISEVYYDDFDVDTTIDIHHDENPISFTDTVDIENIDTSIIYVRHSANGDTTYVGLQPCYAIGPDNELVYICDAQRQPLTTQKLALSGTKLYPIPAREELFLDLSIARAETIQLQVMDVLGRDVTNGCTERSYLLPAGSSNIKLNTSQLPSGTYLLRLSMKDATESRKFTVVH